MSELFQTIEKRFQQAFSKAFGESYANIDPQLRATQDVRFGDCQANFAMGLAKQMKCSPRALADQVCQQLELADICEPPEIAGPGFINLRLLPSALSQQLLALSQDSRLGVLPVSHSQTVVVDFSAPNVAKEMHVGHLRSTIIGDAVVRVLEFLGHQVIRQNHVGDWGTQFGMLIEHLLENGWQPDKETAVNQSYRDLNALYKISKKQFDEDPAFAERSRQRVVALQQGDVDTLAIWQSLVAQSRQYFSAVYERLDVTLQDSDVKGESAYNDLLSDTVSELKAQGLVKTDQGATVVYLPGFVGRDNQPLPLIIQKSDGGYLYATTDLACLRYRIQSLKAERLIYITDARQSQHFAMIFKTGEMAGWLTDQVRVEHVPFGSVLGEDGKPFKTRSGEVVRLVELIDEAERRAKAVMTEKNAQLSDQEQTVIAKTVGMGAIKYADLSSDRVKDYIFSWQRMLAMEGNTAPYMQYAYTRVRSIFRKAAGQDNSNPLDSIKTADQLHIDKAEEKALCLKLLQFSSALNSVAEHLEPHRLCTYLYELATTFSSFYEACSVLKADSEASRLTRLLLCDLTARTIEQGLSLLGIRVLEKM